MQTMKHSLRTLIALILVFSILMGVNVTSLAAHFSDVPISIGEYYLDAINYVTDNGIMFGTTQTLFSPNESLTRAMAITVLYRISGDNGTYNQANAFTDVSKTAYYYNALGWAVANNIASGITSTTFKPNGTVTREQYISFIYRYARHKGYSLTYDENITRAVDYSSVSKYAREPIAWAYEYGVLSRTTLTEPIEPKLLENRKDCALFTARIIKNVEGFKNSRDAFSFRNASTHLVSNHNTTYLMSADDWNLLKTTAQSEGVNKEKINEVAAKKCGGSCFGMSVAAVLDMNGTIDLNGNCCNNVKTIHDIPAPNALTNSKHILTRDFQDTSKQISEVESKINMYQHSWYVPSIQDWVYYIDTDRGLKETVLKLEHGGLGIFSYELTRDIDSHTGFHAVVAYGKPIKTSYGYKVAIYDNRTTNETRWLQITTGSDGWTGQLVYTSKGKTVHEVVGVCKFQSDFSKFRKLDIDGYDNEPTASGSILEEHVMLQVCTTGDFTITNASGKTFNLSAGENSGSLPVYGINFIPSDEYEPCTFLILTDSSSRFSCAGAEGVQVSSFCALSSGEYTEGSIEDNTEGHSTITLTID